MLIPIGDPGDPRIEAYRAVRDRDVNGRHRRFIAEGETVLRVLLARSRFAAESLLVSEKRVAALRDVVAEAPSTMPIYVASQEVMDAIVGFHIHRGVLAVGLRGHPLSASELLAHAAEPALALGLVGIANHDNIGGLFRNAAAFGVQAVLLDDTSCDPLYRKAIRVSVGASLVVPFARAGSADELVEAVIAAGYEPAALSPSGAEPLSSLEGSSRMALLLGAEGPGLPASVLARARTVRIPIFSGVDSLNVATASGIALHHLAHSRKPSQDAEAQG